VHHTRTLRFDEKACASPDPATFTFTAAVALSGRLAHAAHGPVPPLTYKLDFPALTSFLLHQPFEDTPCRVIPHGLSIFVERSLERVVTLMSFIQRIPQTPQPHRLRFEFFSIRSPRSTSLALTRHPSCFDLRHLRLPADLVLRPLLSTGLADGGPAGSA